MRNLQRCGGWYWYWQREFIQVALLIHNIIWIENDWWAFPFSRALLSSLNAELDFPGGGSWSITKWIDVEIEEVDLQQD